MVPAIKTGMKKGITLNSYVLKDIIVKELKDRYPVIIKLFTDLELLCMGCPAEAFQSVASQ